MDIKITKMCIQVYFSILGLISLVMIKMSYLNIKLNIVLNVLFFLEAIFPKNQ